MKTPKRINIQNDLPHLLEAVCEHPDCPDWLKDGLWNVVNDQSKYVIFTASFWISQFEAMHDESEESTTDANDGWPSELDE